MDAKKIIERINNPIDLQNDEAKDWKELTDKHPYFSVGQLLQFGNDYFQEKDNLAFTAIYKSDPIKFADFVNELKAVEKIDFKKVDKKETSIPKKTNSVIEQFKQTINEPVVENSIIEEIKSEDEVVKDEPILAIKIEKPTTIKVEPISPQEDILALINELPNRNIIEEKVIKIETPTEILQTENLTEEEKRQKALMVMMSFTDWLNHFKSKTEKEQIEEQEKRALKTAWQKEKLTAIIEEEQDEIPEKIFKQAMDSISIENALISESLARILAKQGKTDKAIEMYKKLSLRNPEKNSYFADRIKDLLTNNI